MIESVLFGPGLSRHMIATRKFEVWQERDRKNIFSVLLPTLRLHEDWLDGKEFVSG